MANPIRDYFTAVADDLGLRSATMVPPVGGAPVTDPGAESVMVDGSPENPTGPGPAQIAPPPRARSTRNPMSISMVYRAVSIHAITVKQMGFQRFKENVADPRAQDERLPLGSFLRKPNPLTTQARFKEEVTTSLALSGNCYLRKFYDDYNRIRRVEILDPHRMWPIRERGEIRYYYGGSTEPFRESEIQHMKLLSVPGSLVGLGPIQAARAEIDGFIDQRDYSANWFQDSPHPTGILTSDQTLSRERAAEARDWFEESQGGRRRVLVVGSGLSYAPIYLNPKDAQFLETMQFNTTQIARLFGVPASLMLAAVEGNSQTYQNIEQDWLGFIRFSNMQYLSEIEDALTQLLPTFEYTKFNVEALLRSDTTTRYSAYRQGIEAGWLQRSEVRHIENLPVITGIDDQQRPAADERGQADA